MTTEGRRMRALSPAWLLAPRPAAGQGRTAARIGFGAFFLAMAAYNVSVTLPNAEESFETFAGLAWPGFDWPVTHIVQPMAVPFAALLIVFEGGLAVLVLSKGIRVRLALLAALAFLIGLAPFTSWYELANVPLMAWALLLLRGDYDRSLLDMMRHWHFRFSFPPARR